MKILLIATVLLLWSHFIYAQSDSVYIAEVNYLLKSCHDNIDADSVVVSMEKRFDLELCTLSENLMLYGFQNSLNLTPKEIESIENHTSLIIEDFFKMGMPVKIFEEGGVGGGGKIRVEKTNKDGIILHSIFLHKTDVRFENDLLESKLILMINNMTSELIEGGNNK